MDGNGLIFGRILDGRGGGKEIGHLQAQMGIEAQWVDGLRVTDEDTLSVVEMVLCGKVNKRLPYSDGDGLLALLVRKQF